MASEKEMTDLEIKLQIALTALQYYASPENYGQGESFGELSRISDDDLEHKPANRGYDTVGGKRARRALAEINGEVEPERVKKG